ncbi:MAG: hypothetical protein A2V77_16700 [Anaeromyxobacter sp. RBG_16_69_14]|nr:MAG: hypothetical protein A2V77_16700 [Anaeromyxobacter sp. RBG_16_69_14]
MGLCGWGMAIAAVAMAAGATAARADARRVLLLTDGDRDRDLAARVEGQVADLEVTIVKADAALPPDPGAQLAVARARAAEHRAEVVVWFGADGDSFIVRAAQGDRVLVRRVGRVTGALSASASIEAVGLIVRTELRGLAAGGQIADEVVPGPSVPLRPWAELGWTGVLDGENARGHHGVAARVGAALGRWRAAATFAYHPATTLGSPLATIRVEQQSAGVVAGLDLRGPPDPAARWRLGIDLGAAAARFPRVTTAAGPGLTPAASDSPWSPVVTPSVRAAWRLSPVFWLAFSLGADFLLRPPEFGVATGTGFERVSTLRPVEPRALLSLTFDAS